MPADQEESYDDDYAADKPFEKVKAQMTIFEPVISQLCNIGCNKISDRICKVLPHPHVKTYWERGSPWKGDIEVGGAAGGDRALRGDPKDAAAMRQHRQVLRAEELLRPLGASAGPYQ
jgi:hypothetical protein